MDVWVYTNNTMVMMAPLARRITVALPMSKAFDTKTYTLIRKLIHTTILSTIMKFTANYFNGCKTYTTYINHKSKQRQFKTWVPQGGVISPTLFNMYTAYLPPSKATVQVVTYAADITMTFTHTSTNAAKKYIQQYL